MSTQLRDISVYVGDIHGTRLRHLSEALGTLDMSPSGLLCTMDLDQVLSIQDLDDLERRYRAAGKLVLLVPGNHESAIVHRIGIDSSTYRESHQNTSILQLIEALHLPSFAHLRTALEEKLERSGGLPLSLSEGGRCPALLIHGALAGKEEKYLSEFPAELQEHVRTRTDLWARLETDVHIKANFSAMAADGIEVMLRGHDHYIGMRSQTANGELCSHQLVINMVSSVAPLEYRAEAPRAGDNPDDMALVDSAELQRVRDAGELYWHELNAGERFVVNCGPYYEGCFGLVRAGSDDAPPAIAFCQTEVSAFNEDDRKTGLLPYLSAHQARSGKTFYELFPPKR